MVVQLATCHLNLACWVVPGSQWRPEPPVKVAAGWALETCGLARQEYQMRRSARRTTAVVLSFAWSSCRQG